MIYDDQIRQREGEISDLRRRESEYSILVAQSNEVIKTSMDIEAIKTAFVTANTVVAARNNIAPRIAGIEKQIDNLRNDQQAFRSMLEPTPGRIEAKKDELRRLRQRRGEEQDALGRLRTQAQAVAYELARLPKPVALVGVGNWQDDGLAARRSLLLERETSLRFQISRAEGELQINERLVSEAEASIEKM
jgi:chromosome segregation ATPase